MAFWLRMCGMAAHVSRNSVCSELSAGAGEFAKRLSCKGCHSLAGRACSFLIPWTHVWLKVCGWHLNATLLLHPTALCVGVCLLPPALASTFVAAQWPLNYVVADRHVEAVARQCVLACGYPSIVQQLCWSDCCAVATSLRVKRLTQTPHTSTEHAPGGCG